MPKKIVWSRVREIIKIYEGLEGNAGMLAAGIMKLRIQEGEKAIATGDVVEIIRGIHGLRDIEFYNGRARW